MLLLEKTGGFLEVELRLLLLFRKLLLLFKLGGGLLGILKLLALLVGHIVLIHKDHVFEQASELRLVHTGRLFSSVSCKKSLKLIN